MPTVSSLGSVVHLEICCVQLVRAFREANFFLYIHTLTNIVPWMFALDQDVIAHSFITWGILECLLGFRPLGRNPAGAIMKNYLIKISVTNLRLLSLFKHYLCQFTLSSECVMIFNPFFKSHLKEELLQLTSAIF